MNIKNPFVIKATAVANEFIDKYMPSANGEYVKVYLYVLRHEQETIEIADIADALNHTEADVKRALAYWKKYGILEEAAGTEADVSGAGETAAALSGSGGKQPDQTYRKPAQERKKPVQEYQKPVQEHQRPVQEHQRPVQTYQQSGASSAGTRKVYSVDEINRLSGDEEFTQLLYIAQKYMNRLFTQRDSEVMAYLYDGLKLPAELIEYLIEYCVQNQHTSLRYMEKVAIDWHEKGIGTVDQAKARAEGFSKDYFAVMKAFGLGDRRPGEAEITYLDKWFGEYGFTRKMVVDACNRTIEAIHQPSFQYADKILSEWKKAGVRTLEDVEVLAGRRKKTGATAPAKKQAQTNRFHNFEQRNTDYDALVMELWQKEK
ncbi:DnaD domain protein [Clostridium sp. AM58-1XD]|uniref:DnaD domain protein n=1 Tax=Clostridium sp. AM58-1XD TaxID=2292307 RepID=UPI001FA8EBD8|nr:DnaD domain protein [Clostridium sp. AM58-1XD]